MCFTFERSGADAAIMACRTIRPLPVFFAQRLQSRQFASGTSDAKRAELDEFLALSWGLLPRKDFTNALGTRIAMAGPGVKFGADSNLGKLSVPYSVSPAICDKDGKLPLGVLLAIFDDLSSWSFILGDKFHRPGSLRRRCPLLL